MDTAGALLYRSLEFRAESVEIGKKILEKQEKMLEKQDRTIGILEDVRDDTGEIKNALPFLKKIQQ